VKGSRNGFCTGFGNKRQAKKSVHTVISGEGDLVKSDREKAEVHNAFFLASVCTGRVCPQVSRACELLLRVLGHDAVPTAEEGGFRAHLIHLDIQDSMDRSGWSQGC